MPLAVRHPTWAAIDPAHAPTFAALREALEALREAPEVHAVLLTPAEQALPAASEDELEWLAHFPLPTVCALEGEVQIYRLQFALACDIRICDAVTTFRVPRGVILAPPLPLGAPYRPFSAAEALNAGVVSEVARPGEVSAAAGRIVEVIASRGPLAVQLAKEAIVRGGAMPLPQALRFETDLTLLLQTTKDRAEGVAAFLEKRPPRFTGE